MKIDLSNRIRGSLYAGALGDAMGVPYEGQKGHPTFRDDLNLTISDDTQLTLATCKSISETRTVSAEGIAGELLKCYRHRKIVGIGASSLKAMRDLDVGIHWSMSGAKGEMSAGNGAAMRIVPLSFLLDPASQKDRQTLRDVCRITHHNDEAYVGALAVVSAIHEIVFRDIEEMSQLISRVSQNLPDSRVKDRLEAIDSLTDNVSISELSKRFGCSGYVVESIPLALYASQQIDRLPLFDLLIDVIECGGDTDTNASLTGQLVGAKIGASEIPKDYFKTIQGIGEVERTFDEFAQIVIDLN